MVRLDIPTLRQSATAALVVVVPATVLASLLVSNDAARSGAPSLLALVFLIVTMFGFAAAGYTAGHLRSDTPMAHGAAGALLAWAIVQAFGTVRRLAVGKPITWEAFPVWAIIAASMGVFGALFADWYRRR